MGQSVSRIALAKALRVSEGLMRQLETKGFLPNNPPYSCETINEWLAGRANNFDGPITTIESLLDDEENLLTIDEVIERLGTTRSFINDRIEDHNLPFLRIGEMGSLRVPVKEFEHFRAKVEPKGLRNGKFVSQALCLDIPMITQLVHEGALERVTVLGQGTTTWITEQSLTAYLAREDVLSHAAPTEWCHIVTGPDNEMISKTGMLHRFGVQQRRHAHFLASGLIPYIRTPGGQVWLPARFVPPAQFELDGMTPSRLGALFKVDESTATIWRHRRLLCRDDHISTDRVSCPRPACIRSYIAKYATHPSLNADEFWQAITKDGDTLATEAEAEAMLTSSFRKAVERGELVGIWLPRTGSAMAKRALRFLWTDVVLAAMNAHRPAR